MATTRDLTNPHLIFHGALITPQSLRSIKYLPNALISVAHGVIQWIEEDVRSDTQLRDILAGKNLKEIDVIKLERGQFLLPGFIDTHTHAPQFPNLGRGGQYELLDWLSNLTFPTESKFGDEHYARKVYQSVVRRLLDCGTTTCCYFSSSHVVGTKVLADVVNESGQRAFIGHCNMDRNAPAPCVASSSAESLANSQSIISYVNSLNAPLVRPILTPRFAISCTDELLKGLGDLAARPESTLSPPSSDATPLPRLPVQTHISENLSEVHLTASLFPSHASYAAIYDDYGLLGPSTILAHGCYLSLEEVRLIKKSGAGLSHCPTSNFNLSSGVSKVGEWIDEGVKVGLGTDVSGGFSPSMLTAIRHASIASKVIAIQSGLSAVEPEIRSVSNDVNAVSLPTADSVQQNFANRPLPTAALLYMATLGGADLCNMRDRTGTLAPDNAFDALLVDLRSETGNPNVWWDGALDDSERSGTVDLLIDLEAQLEKFLFCGDDRNISAVFVQGLLVGGKLFAS